MCESSSEMTCNTCDAEGVFVISRPDDDRRPACTWGKKKAGNSLRAAGLVCSEGCDDYFMPVIIPWTRLLRALPSEVAFEAMGSL